MTRHRPAPVVPPKTVPSTPGNCVAGFTATGAGVGAAGGYWAGGGAGAFGGGAVGTAIEPGGGTAVGAFGGFQVGSEVGAAGGFALGARAGYLLGNVVCANRSGGGGGSNFGDNQRQNRQANDARKAAEGITGKRFTPAQERKFHDAITGQGLGYHDLVEIAVEVLEGRI